MRAPDSQRKYALIAYRGCVKRRKAEHEVVNTLMRTNVLELPATGLPLSDRRFYRFGVTLAERYWVLLMR